MHFMKSTCYYFGKERGIHPPFLPPNNNCHDKGCFIRVPIWHLRHETKEEGEKGTHERTLHSHQFSPRIKKKIMGEWTKCCCQTCSLFGLVWRAERWNLFSWRRCVVSSKTFLFSCLYRRVHSGPPYLGGHGLSLYALPPVFARGSLYANSRTKTSLPSKFGCVR